MKPPLPRIESAVPQTLHVQLEIAKAMRTLFEPDDEELLRRRRAEIAALRSDLNALACDISKAFEAAAALAKAEFRAALGNSGAGLAANRALLKASPDDPKHPGWPARTPGGKGGQFRPKGSTDAEPSGPTPEAGQSSTSDNTIPYQRFGRGHHWVTIKIFEKRNFSDEVKAFFDDARSGPLADPRVNYNTEAHRAYNDAVNELLDQFLKKNNITKEQMTLAQAEELVQEVKSSTKPVIREFVMKINREVLRYGLRWGPWRRGGGGGDD
jgi:hypothetical protein